MLKFFKTILNWKFYYLFCNCILFMPMNTIIVGYCMLHDYYNKGVGTYYYFRKYK